MKKVALFILILAGVILSFSCKVNVNIPKAQQEEKTVEAEEPEKTVEPEDPEPAEEIPEVGSLKGKAIFSNAQDNSSIQISLKKSGESEPLSCINCNTDGSYTIENLSEGQYTLYATAAGSKEKTLTSSITIVKNTVTRVPDLQFTAIGSLKGKITLDNSADNSDGFLVYIADTSYKTITGSDGSFVISDIPAGSGYKIYIKKDSFETLWIDNVTILPFKETLAGEHNFDLIVINYNLNGGTLPEAAPENYIAGQEKEIILPEPEKSNSYFLGWYYESDFSGEPVTQLSSSAEQNIYARWVDNLSDSFEQYKDILNIEEIMQDEEITLQGDFDNDVIPAIKDYLCIIQTLDSEKRISVDIHDITGITYINSNAFHGCSSLKSIKLPDCVTSIYNEAFSNCKNLEYIELSDSITSIGSSAFSRCTALTSIELPDSLTSIGSAAFSNCSNLKNIEVPDSVNYIGSSAFSNCSSLTSIELPDSLVRIESNTFKKCINLASITIPVKVGGVDSDAFTGCQNLKCTVIYSKTTFRSLKNSIKDIMTHVIIPAKISTIEANAFNGCNQLKAATFEGNINWIYNSKPYVLSNPQNAASLLRKYYEYEWIRLDI